MLTCEAPTTILVTSKSASQRLRELAERFTADAVDPLEYKCLRCHCEWPREACYDWRTAVCSNCYSERVIITVVRLGFENWGEHNGGEAEQRKRYDAAVKATKKAMAATRTNSVRSDVEPPDSGGANKE